MPLYRRICLLIALYQLASSCGSPVAERRRVHPTYDGRTGRLGRLAYDSNANGRADSWSYMEGARVLRVEIDRDEDGRVDRWEYYRPNQTLEKVGLSRRNDGRADTWAYKGPDGVLAEVRIADANGTVRRTEFYAGGVLSRSEEDTTGDGTVDKWETFTNGALTSAAFDTEGTGRATRRVLYDAQGRLVRVERIDRWTPPQ